MTYDVMNQYDCDVCGYRYKPSAHGRVDLDAQPPDFECPKCQSGKDHFHLFTPPSDDVAPSLVDDDDGVDDIDPSGARVMYTSESSPTLISLHLQHKRGRLNTQPDFQRYEVWSTQKKSALIESILLDLPIPQVFLAQEADNTTVAVDGQQRLMAIFRFMSDEYPLKGVTSAIDGRKFSHLSPDLQEKIETYELRVVKILKESDPEVRFMLFQRLNEGSVSLNDQELRNSVWRGPYNDYLKSASDLPQWRKLLNLRARHPRMADIELALRYFAFRDQQYMAHPDKKTSRFLDKQMMIGAGYKDRDYAAATHDFEIAIELATAVFGKHACRRFIPGTAESPPGIWDGRLNRALMDVQLWGFNRYPKDVYLENVFAFREAAIDLMSTREFTDLTTHTISEFRRIERRFDLWKRMVDRVLTEDTRERSRGAPKRKESAFVEDPRCSICSDEILILDDAHLSLQRRSTAKSRRTGNQGGKLTHRYCHTHARK